MRGQSDTAEEKLARLAGPAWGIVTRAEAIEAGLSERQIDLRIEKGLLIVEFPGVYRVGHCAGIYEARYMAAVKACGEDSALMRLAGAYLLGLVRGAPPSPAVLTPKRRCVQGIITCHSRHIDPRDITIHRGIRVTNVPRTLCDMAPHQLLSDLARTCHEAGVKHRTTPRDVDACSGAARTPQAPATSG